MTPACDYCGNPAVLVTGREIYPHRPDLAGHRFYQCKPCAAYVGCYRDGAPLGRLANKELRKAKQIAHSVFDPLWKVGGMTRTQAYAWLSSAMGLPAADTHIGMFTVDQCHQVVNLVADFRKAA